jgi:hypothetical protein
VEDAVDKVMEGDARTGRRPDPDSAYLTAADVKSIDPGEAPGGDVGIELTRQYYLRVIAARDDLRQRKRAPDRRLRPRDRRQAGA